jgi:hypothetical protein
MLLITGTLHARWSALELLLTLFGNVSPSPADLSRVGATYKEQV